MPLLSSGEETVQEIKQNIIAIVAEYTDVSPEEFDEVTSFDELGIDSLSLVEIVFDIEEAFDIKIPQDNELSENNIDLSSFNDLVALVTQLITKDNG